MAIKKRTSVLLNEELLRKVRKSLKASSNTEAITRALRETLTNREIETALKDMIRKGRGRFVDVYR
jgi:metal-responsive CopG/Arc/MetJ family transcriptional regulator